jgi:hypothetical protein
MAASAVARRHSYEHHVPFRSAAYRGDWYGAVESHKPATILNCESQQIDIGQLLGDQYPLAREPFCIGQRDIVSPKPVVRSGSFFGEHFERMSNRHRLRIFRLRYDSHKSILGQWTRSPSRGSIGRPPLVRGTMMCVLRVQQGNQNVHIE